MLRNRKASKVLSLLITMVMILGYFTSFAYAESDQFSLAKEDLREEALMKIQPEVMDDLEKEEFVEVMVYMKNRVDTKNIARATRYALADSMTPYSLKMEVRRAVVEALRDKAETTQASLVNYLEKEMEKGNVEEYTSYHIVNMLYVKATKEVVEQISYMNEVERIYKNKTHQMDISVAGGDDIVPQGMEPLWNITRIGADQVWDLGVDGTGTVVGSLDSGVDWTHPALKNHWRGYNPETGETDPSKSWLDLQYGSSLPEDSDSHGTHVMGTMVGVEPDGNNPIGVAPGAKWITVRVFDRGGYTTDQILLDAAEWMLHPGDDLTAAPDVVNNSWGGLDGIDDWYKDAIEAYRSAEIFPVFSAGNQRPGEPLPWPGSISCPSNYVESFAVAAVDRNDIRASFSKLGPSPYDPSDVKPNISGPGVAIYSSVPGGYTSSYSGTSMSAPHVSGTVALMKSADASLTVEEMWEILESTADPLTDSTYPVSPNFGYGYGMVNAFEAVSRVIPGTGYISGRVLVPGEDASEPTIIHEQEVFEAYFGSDIDIFAEISDDVSITEAELLVKAEGKSYWMLVPMNRISGDYKNGVYKGTITYDMLLSDKLTYRIRVRDFAGDAVITPDYKIEISFGIVPGDYTQGFENNAVGWIFEGDWQWGEAGGVDPVPFEGEGLAGTVLGANYHDNMNSWMITPPIDLRDNTLPTASLRFYHWYHIENNYDKAFVYVTNDYGATWTQVGPMYTNVSTQWKEVYVGLDEFIGSPDPVYVAWNFVSEISVNYPGWYIDNVRIMGRDNEAPAIPTNLKAEPVLAGIKLTWTPSPEADIDVYRIYRSETSGEGYELIGETASNNFTDTDVEANVTYYYVIDAVDFSGNVSEFSNEVFGIGTEVITLFTTDFEEDNGGFTSGGANNSWEWGMPTSGPNGAASGEKLWATNLGGNYSTYSDCYIVSPAIVIPEGKLPVITFNHWYDFEGTTTLWDYGQVEISTDDGATWINVTPTGKYGTRLQQWKYEEILLDNSYQGETIKVRFFFHSDSSVTYPGWYVDDVSVYAINPPPIPEEELITYDDGTAENALVLNAPGNGCAVRFTPLTNAILRSADIYIWSNDWPTPGGNRLGFAVYETHTDGTPRQVGETIFVDNIVRGGWNHIDLTSLNLTTSEDFYISTMQDDIGDYTPGTGLDEDSAHGSRSYLNIAGEMIPLASEGFDGCFMIRADVGYILDEEAEVNSIKADKVVVKPIANADGSFKTFKERLGKDEAPKFNLKRTPIGNYEIVSDNEVQNTPMAFGGIPVADAVVTILETGRSVKVDPVTGKFNMRVLMGDYTLIAEAYGYYDKEAEVTVVEDETAKVNFMLEVKPRGTIAGRVVDRYYGDPASYATIRIVEDPRIAPVIADVDGYFTIPDVLVGTYTLKVGASGFYTDEFEDIIVNPNTTTEVELGLKRFVGYEDEIFYDDGTAENAIVLNAAGNGIAVRFTPSQSTKLKGAYVYHWASTWPTPGSNRMGYAVYETFADGTIKQVGETIFKNDIIRGDWNYIDLSSLNFTTGSDFYISTMQDDVGSNHPGTGIDEDNTDTGRTYLNISGEMQLDPDGAAMIRVIVENSVDTPVITNLEEINYTNQDRITVEGIVGVDCTVNVYVNDEITVTTNSENLVFAVEVDLPLDENTIMVTAELDGRQTEPSPEVRVIKDKVLPVLIIDEPLDDAKVNVEVIRVIGNATDDIELTKVLINEVEVAVDEEGNFNERIFVDEGINIITVKAFDSAGNITIVERTVTVDLNGPEITDMMPDEDVTYYQGDTVEVSFISEPGGEAYFRILMEYAPQGNVSTRIPMVETEPGYYEGTWAIPEGFAIRGGVVEFEFIDAFGNRVVDAAPGRVTILGISMDQLPANTVIIGEEAFDIRFLDTDANAQAKLEAWDGPVYVKLNQNTLVNAEGVLVDFDYALPRILNYFGIKGNLMVYEKLD